MYSFSNPRAPTILFIGQDQSISAPIAFKSNGFEMIQVWQGKIISFVFSFGHGINYSIYIYCGTNMAFSKKSITFGESWSKINIIAESIILDKQRSGNPLSISIIISKAAGLWFWIAIYKAVSLLKSGFRIYNGRKF